MIFSLALLWAIWIGLDAVISRFFTTTDDFKFRWAMWVSTFQILKDFPLFGSGLGTFTYIFPMYRSLHIEGLATHAENDFLQLAAEAGLIGVFASSTAVLAGEHWIRWHYVLDRRFDDPQAVVNGLNRSVRQLEQIERARTESGVATSLR